MGTFPTFLSGTIEKYVSTSPPQIDGGVGTNISRPPRDRVYLTSPYTRSLPSLSWGESRLVNTNGNVPTYQLRHFPFFGCFESRFSPFSVEVVKLPARYPPLKATFPPLFTGPTVGLRNWCNFPWQVFSWLDAFLFPPSLLVENSTLFFFLSPHRRS